ncbi:MAG: PEP-CTERM sorting domain-containing protein [Bythopirellula sp.]|nr:PEP-CTERM sorting domain-containing protein [Bythopirellula sp.]
MLRNALRFGGSATAHGVCLLLIGAASASSFVIRDSIGGGTTLTNGMPGGVTNHDGASWNTPGLVVTAPVDGELTEARFVIFARGPGPVFPPENNLANIYGFPMEFHIWTDGVEGGADSFDLNPQGSPLVPGHIDVDVNTPTESFITIVPFGITGPSNEFTTFLLTVDLSSFNLALEGGHQYVMGLIQDNETNFISGGGFFRISASRATGFEDVFRSFQTPTSSAFRPGYVKTQLLNSFEQYAGAFTLAPQLHGDYDFDGDVDGADFLKWQRAYGTSDSMADGDDSGTVGPEDLVIWQDHYGETAPLTASVAVPEPSTLLLFAWAGMGLLLRRRRA